MIMKKRIVDKSKPVRNLVSRSRAGISTVPSSTASSSPGIFGLEDREVSFKASMEQPVVQHSKKKDLTKGDTMTYSQVWHSDPSSMAGMGAPVA